MFVLFIENSDNFLEYSKVTGWFMRNVRFGLTEHIFFLTVFFLCLGITRLPILEGEVSHVEIPRTRNHRIDLIDIVMYSTHALFNLQVFNAPLFKASLDLLLSCDHARKVRDKRVSYMGNVWRRKCNSWRVDQTPLNSSRVDPPLVHWTEVSWKPRSKI
jgi:hypothetical protein